MILFFIHLSQFLAKKIKKKISFSQNHSNLSFMQEYRGFFGFNIIREEKNRLFKRAVGNIIISMI